MRIYIENDNGTRLEVKEIETLDKESNVILIKINRRLRPSDIAELERYYSEKIGKMCVILEDFVDNVLGV